MSETAWGIWCEEYSCEDACMIRFWLQDGNGNDLTYASEEDAIAACREWFGRVLENMTVKEYRP